MQNTPIKQKFTFLKNIKISCARWGVESLFQVIIYEGEDNWPRLTEFHGQGITPLAAFRNARFNRNLGKDPTLRKVVNRLKGDTRYGKLNWEEYGMKKSLDVILPKGKDDV